MKDFFTVFGVVMAAAALFSFWRMRKEAKKLFVDLTKKIEAERQRADKLQQKLANQKNDRLRLNYPVGTKVIVRSNENQPYLVGKVMRHVPITQAKTLVPLVRTEAGEELMCLGIMHYWSEGKAAALDKLTPTEQWNVMAEFAAKN